MDPTAAAWEVNGATLASCGGVGFLETMAKIIMIVISRHSSMIGHFIHDSFPAPSANG
jgi:hypothetical protein